VADVDVGVVVLKLGAEDSSQGEGHGHAALPIAGELEGSHSIERGAGARAARHHASPFTAARRDAH
jgi:hypothetical protein